MSQAKTLQQEIIDEIGTQTLARFGLNIFSLNTYNAYEASAQGTNIASHTYEQHKNNKNYFGYTFEDIDVAQKNMSSSLFERGERSYTTDTLAYIKKVVEINESNKKIDKLNPKDREKYDFIMSNFPDEVENFKGSSLEQHASKNDPSTDVVTFDKNGKVIEKSQHKAIIKTKDLLKDRYLENNDVLTVPFDDYKRHKEGLEKMIANTKNPEQAQKAKIALEKLNKNNVTNRLMCKNPQATAILTQSSAAAGHVVQAGLSDAIVVALSTLANGAVWEIKDAFSANGSTVSIEVRIKRLLEKILDDFNRTFKRGTSFGAVDVGVGILSQIFTSISSKLKLLWKELRTSLKSIFNAIWSYITGETKSFQELMSIIIKSLLSAVTVVGTVALEIQLEAFLAPIVTPVVASFLAPALSIVIGSIAVVMVSKSVDLALNALFGVIAQRDIAKMKAEKIQSLCEELLPLLIEEREELENLIKKTYRDRRLSFEKSFNDFKNALSNNDLDGVVCGLVGINSLYGAKLQFMTQKEFDDFMAESCSFRF